MGLVQSIKEAAAASLNILYSAGIKTDDIAVNQTKQEFDGEYTIVLFPLLKKIKAAPEQLGRELGSHLKTTQANLVADFNVIKGFLNLVIAEEPLAAFLTGNPKPGQVDSKNVVVEFSSPNTNKPLHLGHLRNIFLGWSVTEILKRRGYDVKKTCIVNDRGIHICKSMIAWQLFGNGETPATAGQKGDHFVGDYYVKCENQIKKETAQLEEKLENGDYDVIDESQRQKLVEIDELIKAIVGDTDRDKEKMQKLREDRKEIIRNNTPVMKQARQMLVDWEAGKPEVITLWKQMNDWVYAGFDETYNRIGISFDKVYYESETYLPGRKFVEMGLEKGVFYKKDDGSVWIDLSDEGLDEKLVLRKDGTSVYITQDLGLAHEKYEDYNYDKSVYVIADEQNYHMKVLQLILKKLQMPYADGVFHLSYGMVELPSGRMKSREGTVVDADDIVQEMIQVAGRHTEESGKVEGFTATELETLYETIGLGALKFYLLRVDPKKRMVFNPEESIDFHGFTGPFIQYTYARIRSIFRKLDETFIPASEAQVSGLAFTPLEKGLALALEQYESTIAQAADELNPSVLAVYAFNLAKTFNTFYSEHSVLNAETPEKKLLRLQLAHVTAATLKEAMSLLGIGVPERM